MSYTVVHLARFRLGMVPPGLLQDRENAATAQAMTNRTQSLPKIHWPSPPTCGKEKMSQLQMDSHPDYRAPLTQIDAL